MSVLKRGKVYWIAFRFNHVRYRKRSPDNTATGARTYEALLRQRLAKGEDINEKPKEKMVNFFDFADKWFETYVRTNNKPSEQGHKAAVLRIHLKPFFGKNHLDKISNLMIEEYKAKKQEQGICNKTINNHIGMLGKCLRCAEEWEIIQRVPKIKRLKVPPQAYKFLTEEEYNLLLKAAKKINRQLYEMILFALRTGVRIGELIAVDWSDINFMNRNILIRRSIVNGIVGSPKSNKTRLIPLAEDIYELLYQRREEKGYVFLDKEGKVHSRFSLGRALERACKAAGIKTISWHPLRHTFASKLANNGISLQVIQTLLGHSDIKMTQRYAHLEPQTMIDAIRTLLPKEDTNLFSGHNMATTPEITPKIGSRNQPAFSYILPNIK